jgi:hypothetical protein
MGSPRQDGLGRESLLPRDIILEPTIVLFGCRPHVPFQRGWHDHPSSDQHFHAPPIVQPGDHPWPREHCPTCKGLIGLGHLVYRDGECIGWVDTRDDKTACATCGSMSPGNESRAQASRIGVQCRSSVELDELLATRELDAKLGGRRLTESDKRRLWIGSKSVGLSCPEKIHNRARVGREWLTRIGQFPNPHVILDRRGNVRGMSDVPVWFPFEVPGAPELPLSTRATA